MRMVRSLVLAAGLIASGAGEAGAAALSPGAPGSIFAQPSPGFLQAPPFDRLKDTDYQPAIEAGMARELEEIEAIVANKAAPSFDNTIAALERTGQLLARADAVFSALAQANTNDTLQAIERDEAPKYAAHDDAIYLNPRLFARVKAVYDRRASLKLTPEQAQVLKLTYEQFARRGAALPEAQKTRLKALNEQLSVLETAFQQKLLAAAKAAAPTVEKAALAGLSEQQIAALGEAAQDRGLPGKLVIPLQNTTQQPLLQDLADRATREALFNAGWTRAERGDGNDVRDTIATIAQLRAEKAALLGFPTYAAYAVQDQMVERPATVDAFMAQIAPPARARAESEAADIQTLIDQDGAGFQLKPWDWNRYAERVRKARYDLSDEEVKPYFELDRVLKDGVFFAANQLYGLTFTERKDIPVYHPDVRVFEVHDKDGSLLSLVYFDYFKRDNKAGGAWAGAFIGQSKLLGTKPVLYNVANLTKPAPGQPALISFDDVTTMFHEFGHTLHGMFADQTYPSISGTRVARDFVEFPSQFNEYWALDPKVVGRYAVHYRTGAPIPQALLDKIRAASKFNQGYAMSELIAAAALDMKWHGLSRDDPKQDVDAFETQALRAAGLDIPNVPPRYRSSYFLHIWSNGYSAGYYAYLWTQMLADDTFDWFSRNGGLTRANGQRLRDLVLSRGHSQDYAPMFRGFYGKDPEIGPMLKYRGLAGDQAPPTP